MTTEEEDEREARALARTRRIRRRVAVLVPLLLLAAPFIWYSIRVGEHEARERERRAAAALDEGEVEALRAALERAEARADEALSAWRSRVDRRLLDAASPGGGPCRAGIEPPRMGAGESYVEHGSIDGNYFGGWSYRLIERDAADWAIGPPYGLASARDSIAAIRDKLERGEAERGDLRRAESLASGRAWSRDPVVVVAVDERRDPYFVAGIGGLDSFEPGVLRGRAYVVDGGSGHVICVGDVSAMNSPTVDFRYLSSSPLDESSKRAAAEATLARDFEVELRRAIAASLEGAL